MKDYDVCKNFNSYYFKTYTSVPLMLPKFFTDFSEEGQAVTAIIKLIEEKDYDAAIELAESSIAKASKEAENGLLAWQIVAMWHKGVIPNSELLAFFSTFEELYPDDAFIHFDKAILLVREGQFNEAMKQLKLGDAKSPGNGFSTVLQFWICYFAQDHHWHSLLERIEKNRLMSEEAINLVKLCEAVSKGNTTAHFKSAEHGDLHEKNKTLFLQFPDFEMLREPVEKNVLLVAAETNYLNTFVFPLLLSARELKTESFGIHVHLYDPLGTDIELLQEYERKYPELKLSYSREKRSFTIASDNGAYYASMRFCRAYQVFEQSAAIQRMAIVDADSLVRKDPFSSQKIMSSDVTLTSHEMAPIWDRFAAGFSCFAKTPSGRNAFAHLVNIILQNFIAGTHFWMVDQIAIFDMYQRFGKNSAINRLPLEEVFGKDMAHTDSSIFWTYTNEDKFKDNPMNRERRRLFDNYGIDVEWNCLGKGKYGTILANKNDEYVGRQLLAHGKWCDHEMALLKRLLEPGDTVLEVGSNIGSHTLPLAKFVGNRGRVYAMEPQRLLFQTLCANIALNSMSNVFTLNAACGETVGTLRIGELDPSVFQNFGGFKLMETAGDVEVPLRTIDSLGLSSCKLIKIDIEGMEIDAMKGGRKTLQRLQPILFFESHGDAVKPIADFLQSLDYKIYDFHFKEDPMYIAATQRYAEEITKLCIKSLKTLGE